MKSVDYEVLSRELIRALRGRRSQVALSRRLKYKSNVVYLWESGRNWPTAAVFLWAASRVGVDVDAALSSFYRQPPSWLDGIERQTIARLLDDLRGQTPILALAQRTGRSRYAVARWLKGQSEPRLPDFLRLLEACSQRLLDFVSRFVDPAALPSVSGIWAQLQAARTLVGRLPWAPAVLLAMQTAAYADLEEHRPGFLSERLGLPEDVEEECIELLATSGQIHWANGKWHVAEVVTIDTRADPRAGRRLKEWWAEVGIQRMHDTPDGVFSYNVFSVSSADFERLKQMHLAHFRAMRALISASHPEQRVCVANLQLFPLERESG